MSYEIEIEKDIPMPDTSNQRKYPFADMEVGHSFFAPVKARTLMNAASHHRRKKNWTFTTAPETKDGLEGTRIWRKS